MIKTLSSEKRKKKHTDKFLYAISFKFHIKFSCLEILLLGAKTILSRWFVLCVLLLYAILTPHC